MPSASASRTCVPKCETASIGLIGPVYRHADISVNRPPDMTRLYHAAVSIGQRIRQRRKALGMTQVDVAKLAGIKQSSLSDIERGETAALAADTLLGLCKALRTTARWITLGMGDHDAQQHMSEQELHVLQLLRTMSEEQQAIWIRIGRALLDQSPPDESDDRQPFRLS